MRRTKIWTISIFLIPLLIVIPINMIITPLTTLETENKDINEELKISTESGGGYLMNTDATYSWIEIQSTGNLMTISDEDDESEGISFIANGWTFPFYETLYDAIVVSSNGWMSFPDLGDTNWLCNYIPSVESENIDCVALLAEDLYPGYSGNIYYQFFDSGPNRYLVIEYSQIYNLEEELVGDFEVIFYENGNIKFQYKIIHDIPWLYPIIGLDHGDLTNYNRYDVELPLSSKAIEFTFNQMIEIEYGFNFNIEDTFSWLVLDVDHTKMDQAFGINWETDFGLYPDMLINQKTKINISSIMENSTHWEINYNSWDWISKYDTFSSSYDGIDTISYRKEPLNYTSPHLLPNYYPFLLPNHTIVYLTRANLDYYYDQLQLSNYGNIILESHINIGPLEHINVEAIYTSSGILDVLEISKSIYMHISESIYKSFKEVIFLMVRYLEGPKPFYVGVNEGEVYEYGAYYSAKNALPYSMPPPEELPDRIRISVDFIGGEDPEFNRSLVITTLSERWNNTWRNSTIYENYLYRNIENIELVDYMLNQPIYVEPTNIDWDSYALKIQDCFTRTAISFTVTGLNNGIKLSIGVPGYTSEIIATYNSSSGVLDILSYRVSGKEFLTYRLDDFDYKIKGKEVIPGMNCFILYLILLMGIISIAWQIKRKIT
ncbi:MAG: hypothetical protein ACFFAQ_16440 [Promethearchaeota archaeon]